MYEYVRVYAALRERERDRERVGASVVRGSEPVKVINTRMTAAASDNRNSGPLMWSSN